MLTPQTARNTLLAICLVLIGGCSSILRNPVPEELHLQVSILGRQDLRVWGDQQEGHSAFDPFKPDTLEEHFEGIMHTEHHYLAISGGGADGAYGAGLLVGWSKKGTRPEFTMVTGVSTGALTAPFAFLGATYDQQLKALYTTLDSSSIFSRRNIFTVIRGDSLADSAPLARMLEKHITDKLIAAIAREYRRGRSLRIGTTNLDAGRSVVWNIGRIAASGHPDAPDLIRQILLASASIPGLFPPAYIRVQGPDGRTYQEMHVDGGTSSQMFLYPPSVDWAELLKLLDVRGTPTAYLIRNSRLQSDYQPVRARVPNIAARAIESLIRTQGIGDAYRIAAISNRDGVGVKMTWIPMTAVRNPGDEEFDPKYMSALFDYGFQRALSGSAWIDININKLMKVEDL